MNNSVVNTALITKLISKPLAATADKPLKDVEQDVARRVVEYRRSLGLDRRNVAIANCQSIWIWDQYLNMQDEWQAVIESTYIEHESILMLRRPASILCFDPYMSGLAEFKKKFPSTEITFFNNDVLAEFEQHVRDYEPGYDYDYSVVDYEDLGVEKFDFIQGFAWNFVDDTKFVQLCIDSLNSNGVMLVSLSNQSAKLYLRAQYHAHPYVDMHRVMLNNAGNTYHIASGYGITTFIKS